MNLQALTFRKAERLCSRDAFTKLFDDGNILYTKSFRIIWRPESGSAPAQAQAAFSVGKKNFRKAVDRNLLKRRMREAYRLEKKRLYEHLDKINLKISLIIIYRENTINNFAVISQQIALAIDKLCIDLNEKHKTI